MQPRPATIDEHQKKPRVTCTLDCIACGASLLYQRQERPRFPPHFFWCPRCGARYAAREQLVTTAVTTARVFTYGGPR